MKEIQNQKSIPENLITLDTIIGGFIDELNIDPIRNRKKIIEVCHTGKFLMLLEDEGKIESLSEKPDFIIQVNSEVVGLEHQILIDEDAKEREGFFENIFLAAESQLQSDAELPNFLANCYLNNNLTFRLADKPDLIQEVKTVVKQYVLSGVLIPNSLIDRISAMPHSQKNISPNFGAWWQKEVTTEAILSAIAKKEAKIQKYIQNSVATQWLLLVIGGLNNSSFELKAGFDIELNTLFDRVYLLEDFRARLVQLK